MEITKDQLITIICITANVEKYSYPTIADAINEANLPEEVALMIATAKADKEEW